MYQYLSQNVDTPVENRISSEITKPYVAMGDLNGDSEGARSIEGLNLRQELLIYSNFNGKDEVIDITDEIRELVTNIEIKMGDIDVHSQAVESFSITQVDEKLYEAEIVLRIELFEF